MNEYQKFQVEYYANPYNRAYNGRPLDKMVERTIKSKAIVWHNEMVFDCEYCHSHGDTDSSWMFNEIGEYTYCPRCGHPLDWSDELAPPL